MSCCKGNESHTRNIRCWLENIECMISYRWRSDDDRIYSACPYDIAAKLMLSVHHVVPCGDEEWDMLLHHSVHIFRRFGHIGHVYLTSHIYFHTNIFIITIIALLFQKFLPQ